MKRIAVLTSGGDAPGMNAAIRAVVRTALADGMEVVGVQRGFRGLFDADIRVLSSRDVAGIIDKGGTILKSIRFPEMRRRTVVQKCLRVVREKGIEGLVVIGGDGSCRGAYRLWKEGAVPVVVIPASIDNDVYGTDYTVGFDTAVNTALDAVDRIRDTATSHERTFIVEVMGREHGNLALEVGLCCGAEIIVVPEAPISCGEIVRRLRRQGDRGKQSSIIILAEGAGSAGELAAKLSPRLPSYEIRCTVLGYILRGGRPSYLTRSIATRCGVAAVKVLAHKKGAHLVGIRMGRVCVTPLRETVSRERPAPVELLDIVNILAT